VLEDVEEPRPTMAEGRRQGDFRSDLAGDAVLLAEPHERPDDADGGEQAMPGEEEWASSANVGSLMSIARSRRSAIHSRGVRGTGCGEQAQPRRSGAVPGGDIASGGAGRSQAAVMASAFLQRVECDGRMAGEAKWPSRTDRRAATTAGATRSRTMAGAGSIPSNRTAR
jgi:hypothetical protein